MLASNVHLQNIPHDLRVIQTNNLPNKSGSEKHLRALVISYKGCYCRISSWSSILSFILCLFWQLSLICSNVFNWCHQIRNECIFQRNRRTERKSHGLPAPCSTTKSVSSVIRMFEYVLAEMTPAIVSSQWYSSSYIGTLSKILSSFHCTFFLVKIIPIVPANPQRTYTPEASYCPIYLESKDVVPTMLLHQHNRFLYRRQTVSLATAHPITIQTHFLYLRSWFSPRQGNSFIAGSLLQ